MIRAQIHSSEHRGRIAILAGSAALHIGALAWLGLAAIERQNDSLLDQTPFVIEMSPRLRLSGPAGRTAEINPLALTTARTATELGLPPAPAFHDDRPSTPRPHLAQSLPDAPAPGATAPVRPGSDAALARSLRNVLGCRLGRSNLSDQDACDQALAEAAGRASPIRGSGNEARDARFAALGAEALARYEDKRKPLKPYSRAEPCPGSPNPGDDCAFSIQGRIWSNRDGWLPDLPRPH